ncbi:R3H and coiled-coil domain-containing protein 1 [Mortierella alpina]|uniref:R3H and coiled-coil domain-containing protein 1 n=1 Tax=Mortierella alpina TaxID=64518 RepID=A0A9P6LZU0_MORAP|nr:R3H and coiled-coil domain-containing protein 1 [Mortierella alpina]
MSDSNSSQNQNARRVPKVGVYVPRHRRGTEDVTPNAESGDSGRSSSASSPRLPSGTGRAQRHNDTSREETMDGGLSPRRYSDDENRPNSGFSRSSSYSSLRSNNNSNSNNNNTINNSTSNINSTNSISSASSSHSSSNARSSAGRGQDAYERRADRAEEGSWRRTSPKITDTQDHEGKPQEAFKAESAEEPDVASQLERMHINAASEDQKEEGAASPDELEDWELALEDSDEDAIPRLDSTKGSGSSTPPHPAEHLLGSSSSSPKSASKIGNWSDVSNDDLYILELYGFSPSIKTMHLTDMFAAYENRSGGFRIKWVDDTKALVIFESAAVAKQAYIANLTSQIAKIKPYNGPDKDSIRNAGKPSSGAYNAARPAKTDTVARRLVQGALGLRVRRTPEQIAEEKALVQAAKEAREAQRQEQQKQRQEMDAIFNS